MFKKSMAAAVLACCAFQAQAAVLIFNNVGDPTPIINFYDDQANATFTTLGNINFTFSGNGNVFVPGNNNFPRFDATRAGTDYIFTSFTAEPTSVSYFGTPVPDASIRNLLLESFTGNVGTVELSTSLIPGQNLEFALAVLPTYRWDQAFFPGNPTTGEPVTGEVPLPGTAYLFGIGAMALIGRKKLFKA